MKQNAWDVYLNDELIDTVFYDENCDKDYVLRGLIEHDGYDPEIEIRLGSEDSDPEFFCRPVGPSENDRWIIDAGRTEPFYSECETMQEAIADCMDYYGLVSDSDIRKIERIG